MNPILNPSNEDKEKFGLLAYVEEKERNRVMNLDLLNRKRYHAYLTKRIKHEKGKKSV